MLTRFCIRLMFGVGTVWFSVFPAPVPGAEQPYAINHRHNDELNRTELVRYADGSQEKILYTFRNSVDAEGTLITERVDEYVIRIEKDDGKRNLKERTVSITDRYGITYSGDQLSRDEKGVSFINHDLERVWVRSDGSRLVKRDKGKGGGYETDEGGRLARNFDADGENTHVYKYQTRTVGEAAETFPPAAKKEIHLTEFLTTDSEGEQQHWKKTKEDEATGKQLWHLQNHVSGKPIPLEHVEHIRVGRDGGIIITRSNESRTSEGVTKTNSSQRFINGSMVDFETTIRPDGSVRESRGVSGDNTGKPAYQLEKSTRSTRDDDSSLVSFTLTSGAGVWQSEDGESWRNQDESGMETYYRGSFRILDDGTFYQSGFETDKNGKRLVRDGKPVQNRKLVIYTNGDLAETLYYGTTIETSTATLLRESSDILKMIDANGRTTTFGYSEQKDAEGRRLVNRVFYPGGAAWGTDDGGRTFYELQSGRTRDPLDHIDLIVNRATGAVTYDKLDDEATVRLDGTIEIQDKRAHVRRTFDGHGQIVSCVHAYGTHFEFEYLDDQELAKAVLSPRLTVTAGGPRVSYADHIEEPVDDLRVDGNGRVSYAKMGRRHVHFPNGSTAIYDASENLISLTDANDVRTECKYEGRVLKSSTRESDGSLWRINRTGPGKLTLTVKDANDAAQSESNLVDASFSDQASLTLRYDTTGSGHLAYQTFHTDGSRREVWRDYSLRDFDSANRMTLRQAGKNRVRFTYDGDQRIPTRIWEEFGSWSRSEQPATNRADGTALYHWTDNTRYDIDGRPREWTGTITIDKRGDYLYPEPNAFICDPYPSRGERERIYVKFNDGGHYLRIVGSGRVDTAERDEKITRRSVAEILKPARAKRGLVATSQDKRGRFYKYLFSGTGTRRGIFELTSDGKKTKGYKQVPEDLQRIDIDEQTGQPTLTHLDGSLEIHMLNGALVATDPNKKPIRVTLPQGDQLVIGQSTVDGMVSAIAYDEKADVVRLQFANGVTAGPNARGDLIVRDNAGRLRRTLSADATYAVDYDYSDEGSLRSIVEKTTFPNQEVRVRKLSWRKDEQQWILDDASLKSEGPKVAYQSIHVSSDRGGQTRVSADGRAIQTVSPAGTIIQASYDWSEPQLLSTVELNALGDVRTVIDSQGNIAEFFRNDAGDVTLITSNGYESMRKNSDGTWTTSYDPESEEKANGSIKGIVTVDKDGNQTWTNDGRTVYRHADGSIKAERADGSYFYENAMRTVKEYGHTSRSKIAKVFVRTDGSGEVVYRDGKRLRRYPNQHLLALLDDQGNERSTRRGWFVVTDDGTVTELNAFTHKATIYYRDGSTIELGRMVPNGGRTGSSAEGHGNGVDLRWLGSDDPTCLGPKVGLGAIGHPYSMGKGSSMLQGLDFLTASPSQSNITRIRPWTLPSSKTVQVALATPATKLHPNEATTTKTPQPKSKEPAASVTNEFAQLDKDGSNELSDAELGETRTGWLKFGDKDGSGGLSRQEWKTVADKVAFGDKLIEQNRSFVARRFEKFDRNSDGKLEKDEIVPELAKKLAETDANQDGIITLQEYQAASAKWREQALRRAIVIP